MNEHRFGKEIKALLNQDLDLPVARVEQLRQARERALAKQRAPSFEWVPAWAGRALGPIGVFRSPSSTMTWAFPVLIAVTGVLGFQHWQASQVQEEDPITEIDSELLKSDLPIDAHLDRGFKHWLKGDAE